MRWMPCWGPLVLFLLLFPFPTTSRVGISARGRRLQRGVSHRRIGRRRFTVVTFASSLSSHSHVANDRFIDVDELMRHGYACWPVFAPPRCRPRVQLPECLSSVHTLSTGLHRLRPLEAGSMRDT